MPDPAKPTDDEKKSSPPSGKPSGLLAVPSRKGRRAAPTPCPLRIRIKPSDFFKDNKLPPNANSVFMFGVVVFYKYALDPKIATGDIPVIGEGDFDTPLSNDEKDWLAAVNADRICWLEYAYDLIACFQVKDLGAENVASYFAATGSILKPNNQAVSLLAWVSRAIPTLDLKGLRVEMASWNPFVDYHTKAFSSASLIIRFAESFPDVMKKIFPTVDLDKVREVDDESWDLSQSYRLPGTLMGIVSIWVTHSGIIRPPNRWYQGEKARAMMPIKEVTVWERFFRAEERSGVPEFKDDESPEDMVTKIAGAGFGKDGVKIADK